MLLKMKFCRKRYEPFFEENKGRYGSGRISKVLAEYGIMCSRKRTAKLMRMCELYPKGVPENIGANTVINRKDSRIF